MCNIIINTFSYVKSIDVTHRKIFTIKSLAFFIFLKVKFSFWIGKLKMTLSYFTSMISFFTFKCADPET